MPGIPLKFVKGNQLIMCVGYPFSFVCKDSHLNMFLYQLDSTHTAQSSIYNIPRSFCRKQRLLGYKKTGNINKIPILPTAFFDFALRPNCLCFPRQNIFRQVSPRTNTRRKLGDSLCKIVYHYVLYTLVHRSCIIRHHRI